jgi:hypothetical protein
VNPGSFGFSFIFSSYSSYFLFARPNIVDIGLAWGFFSDQKSQFGYILEDLGMENIVLYIFCSFRVFYDHRVYFVCILQSFGVFFPCFAILYQEKTGSPDLAFKDDKTCFQSFRKTTPGVRPSTV